MKSSQAGQPRNEALRNLTQKNIGILSGKRFSDDELGCIYDYIFIRFIRHHSSFSSKQTNKQKQTTTKPPFHIIIYIITHPGECLHG